MKLKKLKWISGKGKYEDNDTLFGIVGGHYILRLTHDAISSRHYYSIENLFTHQQFKASASGLYDHDWSFAKEEALDHFLISMQGVFADLDGEV